MSTIDERETSGSQIGPSESGDEQWKAVAAVCRHIVQRVVGEDGSLRPEADLLIKLRSGSEAREALDDLIAACTPRDVSPNVWARWLAGGSSPFGAAGIKNPSDKVQSRTKTLSRGPASIRMYRDQVEAARENLAAAEERLAYHEALDKSLLHFVVGEHLIKILAPIFAAGPLFTVARACSAHVPQAVLDDALSMVSPSGVPAATKRFLDERKSETETILEGLDYFSGFQPFEEALRGSILQLIRQFEAFREQAGKDGRRKRSAAARAEHIHPKVQHSAADVLSGLTRAAE